MSKAALALVGLVAGIGVLVAVKSAEAAETIPPPDPNDNIDTGDDVVTPEPDEPPDPGPDTSPGQPSAGEDTGSGSGEPIITDPTDPNFARDIILTAETILSGPLANVDLRGIKTLHFEDIGSPIPAPGQPKFMEWSGTQDVAGSPMPVHVFVSFDNPEEWITGFRKEDPPGSIPPFHWILFRVSDTPNRDWMIFNILHRTP